MSGDEGGRLSSDEGNTSRLSSDEGAYRNQAEDEGFDTPQAATQPAGDLLEEARAWRDQDPDDATKAELDALIADAEAGDEAATAALRDRFSSRLEFGTAGLRGQLGAGPNRMNRVLVAKAAAGFAEYLKSTGDSPSVVIGYDGRVNSSIFATDTAEIMAGLGIRAILLPRLLPTPVLAFAVRHLGVSAGVMVTASHNPANDNGYKVYLGGFDGGSQIVAPADAAIAAEIDKVGDIRELRRETGYEVSGEEVLDEYVRQTAGLAAPRAEMKVVYTALHGVGWETVRRVFADAGFGQPEVVPEQIEPNAAFPTVAFPNPEEPGAMDLAFARASEVGAELVIANDPDADRLAVAIPAGEGWRSLTGNEIGYLLGWRAARRLQARRADGTLAASIVSSPALREVARQFNLDYVDTLTGFKWISRAGGLAYGYEEALGYLVDPEKVRDKDGISAAVDFLSLVSELKAEGKSVDDHLLDFADTFGAFASSQVSVRVQELSDIPHIMGRLREHPVNRIGSLEVESIDDFRRGFGAYPPSDILRIWLKNGARVIVRPSGTEPKLKVYIDASSTTGSAQERVDAAAAVVAELDRGMRELVGR